MAENPGQLLPVLRRAWCADTAWNRQWSKDNPPLNQCAVTALVVQTRFGGENVRGIAHPSGKEEVSHYWNRIDGEDHDLTAAQFPHGTSYSEALQDADAVPLREQLLANEDTRSRFELLLARVHAEGG